MAKASSELNGHASRANHGIQSGMAEAEAGFQHQVKQMEKKMSDLSTQMSDKLDERREYIQENPIKSVAIAAAGGILVGSIAAFFARRK